MYNIPGTWYTRHMGNIYVLLCFVSFTWYVIGGRGDCMTFYMCADQPPLLSEARKRQRFVHSTGTSVLRRA